MVEMTRKQIIDSEYTIECPTCNYILIGNDPTHYIKCDKCFEVGEFLYGEEVVTGSSSSSATLSGTFTVPSTASLGYTRMRVSMKCLSWFLGHNDLGAQLYNYQTGGCKDGLHSQGTNSNEGAESTLAWLISLFTMYKLFEDQVLVKEPSKEIKSIINAN